MGCNLKSAVPTSHPTRFAQSENAHNKARPKARAIYTRRGSSKQQDNITQNIILNKEPLTNLQITFAVTSLQKQSLFGSLSDTELKAICSLMVSAYTKKGEYVFQQEDQGYYFFLIQDGQVEIETDGKKISTLNGGQIFGEMALILKIKRSISIKTKTDCKFLIMKPLLFKQTIEKLKSTEYELKRQSLEIVSIFEGLTNRQKLNLANALKIIVYQKGQRIVTKNQLATTFFIINQGKVLVTDLAGDDIYLNKYQTFGQNALLPQKRRKATVIAYQKTVCSIISRQEFQKNSGINGQIIFFYNLKKWGLTNSEVFKNFEQNILNAINFAFEMQYAQAGTKIRNNGLVIFCLQEKIRGNDGFMKVYGQKEWKQGRSSLEQDLIQQKTGYYAYLSFNSLNTLLKSFQKRKESNNMEIDTKKKNLGFMDLSNFEYLKDLGEGKFGKVRLVRQPKMQRLYALKQISKRQMKKQGLNVDVENQRRILQMIEFPFIVGFVKAFYDEKNVYFLMEYIKSVQLLYVMRQLSTLSKQTVRYFLASIILSIEYLHQHDIIYRDIKPQNSLIDSNGRLFLVDLGAAKFLKSQNSFRTYTVIGTPHYMSPEVFSVQGYSFESDIWSIGVLMYELLCDKLPFGDDEEDVYKLIKKIKNQKITYPKNLQSQAEQLLRLMLNKNPKQRAVEATFKKIKESAYFEGFSWSDMLKQKISSPYIPKKFQNKTKELETIHMKGRSLTKILYPEENPNKLTIVFKEWNDDLAF